MFVFPYFNLICIDTTLPDSSHPLRSFPHKADHKKQVCPGGAANHYTFFTGYRTHGCLSRHACYTLSASVLHSGSQNRKKPVVGCHNRFFNVLQCYCTVVVIRWSRIFHTQHAAFRKYLEKIGRFTRKRLTRLRSGVYHICIEPCAEGGTHGDPNRHCGR